MDAISRNIATFYLINIPVLFVTSIMFFLENLHPSFRAENKFLNNKFFTALLHLGFIFWILPFLYIIRGSLINILNLGHFTLF